MQICILQRSLLQKLLLALCLCPWAGCAYLDSLAAMQKPTARLAGVGIQKLGLDAATLAFQVEIQNPYPVALPLTNLDYRLTSAGTAFLSGASQAQGLVPALSRKTLALPITVRYVETLQILKGIRPGAIVPYESELGLSFAPKSGNPLRLPLRATGQLPVPALPEVSLTDIQWSRLDLAKVEGMANLRVANPNQFRLDLSKLNFALALGGTNIANGSLLRNVALAPNGGSGTLQIPISLSPAQLGSSLLGLVQGKGAPYRITGALESATPFGPLTLPLEKAGDALLRR